MTTSQTPDAALRRDRRRLYVFAALCAVLLLVAGGYILIAARRSSKPVEVTGAAVSGGGAAGGARVLMLAAGVDPFAERRVIVVEPDGARRDSNMRCQRVYAAGGRGLCVLLEGGAAIFDPADMHEIGRVAATGLPSRARVSAGGRYASMTHFVFGDSYAGGGFSTRTRLIDMGAGTEIAEMEGFTIERDGRVIQSADFNFWGVTFAPDPNRFYATLGTGGKTYLIEGDVAARRARVLRENVECPSLSPDGTRIVFKRRVEEGPPAVWRLYLLDLVTGTETPLPETRNVDDQAEWLDAGHVLYQPVTPKPEIWVSAVEGTDPPKPFAAGAVSPAVLRDAPR